MLGDRAAPDHDTALVSRHIQGMVFLGTPFRGSRHAKWANMLQNIAHAFHETNTQKIKDLETKSEKLKMLAEAFPDVISKRRTEGPKIGVMFCIETLPMKLKMLSTTRVGHYHSLFLEPDSDRDRLWKRTPPGYQVQVITREYTQTILTFANLMQRRMRATKL